MTSNLEILQQQDPDIYAALIGEEQRQKSGIELIPSENYTFPEVLSALGSVFTNKYAEGYPGTRYSGGCDYADVIETLAIDRAKQLFGCEFANVQPNSGSQMNQAVFLALLQPGDTFMGLDLNSGGHLTHGSPVNMSGKWFNPVSYGVRQDNELIDMDEVMAIAKANKPKLIIAGGTAYSRVWDWAAFRKVADEVGAYLMVDMSHISGLVAGGAHPNPFPHAHVVTTTTHKTLRGPRGGLIMMGKDFENPFGLTLKSGKLRSMSSLLNSGVFPGNQGGPLEHIIAAKAIAFEEALTDDFMHYILQVKNNADAMARAFVTKDYNIISGGTDNHMMLIDLRNKNITGKDAEQALVKADITVNKNMVPFDDKSPFVTSGIRVGTPAITTRGLKETDMEIIVSLIDEVIRNYEDDSTLAEVANKVNSLMSDRPLFS